MKAIYNGILLKRIDYSETSLVLQFYTAEEGVQSFLFQGAKRKNKKGNFLQALSIVEISSYSRPDSDLGKITAINPIFVPQQIPFHPLKSGVVFFMAEVLLSVLKSTDSDVGLYSFLEQEIKWLDVTDELTNYPLWFLLKLTDKLGIGVHVEDSKGKIFDLQDGIISNRLPSSHLYVNDHLIPTLIELMQSTKTTFLAFPMNKIRRRELMHHLIDYFQLHISGFKPPKSLSVLQTLFE